VGGKSFKKKKKGWGGEKKKWRKKTEIRGGKGQRKKVMLVHESFAINLVFVNIHSREFSHALINALATIATALFHKTHGICLLIIFLKEKNCTGNSGGTQCS